MFTKISHFGVIVKDLEEALNVYTNVLGLNPPEHRMDLPEIGVKSAFLRIGDFGIELIETTDTNPKNEFIRFLDKHGEGVYHICVIVDDIEAEIQSLKSRGAEVLEVPPSQSLGQKRAFIKRRSAKGVLIEMLQDEIMT